METQEKCPYCGNEEFIEGMQTGYGSISPANEIISFKSQVLYHKICLNCGTVVKSYVKNPSALVKKKH